MEDKRNRGDNKQQVNQTPCNVKCSETEEPSNQKDDKQNDKHRISLKPTLEERSPVLRCNYCTSPAKAQPLFPTDQINDLRRLHWSEHDALQQGPLERNNPTRASLLQDHRGADGKSAFRIQLLHSFFRQVCISCCHRVEAEDRQGETTLRIHPGISFPLVPSAPTLSALHVLVREQVSNSMKHSKIALTVLSCAATVACYGQSSGTQPDNTKVNERDRHAGAVTAGQQKGNAADRELTQKIRQSVMADKSLSTYAHNIKIISQNGTITLRGPVQSDEEKKAVVAKAVAITGSADKVTDQISVKR